jgi:hypothetical protein
MSSQRAYDINVNPQLKSNFILHFATEHLEAQLQDAPLDFECQIKKISQFLATQWTKDLCFHVD